MCVAQENLRNNDIRKQVMEKLEIVRGPPSTALFNQGDVGDAFYVLLKGKASIRVNDQEVATCGPGEAFGERSLTSDQLVRTPGSHYLAMYAC